MATEEPAETSPLNGHDGSSDSMRSSMSSFSSVSNCSNSPAHSPSGSPNNNSNNNRRSTHRKHHGSKAKFKLISEGDIQVCRLNHTRTIISKIMNSKYLRRWESHHLLLSDTDIKSLTVSVKYCAIPLYSFALLCIVRVWIRADNGLL